MSDVTTTDEPDATPGDEPEPAVTPAADEADEGPADGQPELDEDAKATFDEELVDDIAEEIDEIEGADDRKEIDGEQEKTDDATSSAEDRIEDLSLSWGDLYLDTLATLLVVVVEEYGDAASITEDEIVELAQSGMVDISAAVDKLVADMGGPASLPPEYAVLIGTALLVVAVLARETDVLKDALGGEDPIGGTA